MPGMSELVALASTYGVPTVVVAAVIVVVLRSEFAFHYPRSPRGPGDDRGRGTSRV